MQMLEAPVYPLLIRNTKLWRCENSGEELGISAFSSEVYVKCMENS